MEQLSMCGRSKRRPAAGEAMNIWEMLVIAGILIGGVYYFMKRD
jgi:LPXTG-motif cell wall-anchored protein